MINYNTRPKINSKIIFNNILPNTKNGLIIGKSNFDLIEIFKSKGIKYTEFSSEFEENIIEFLEKHYPKEYDIIIFNFELSNYHKLNNIINLILDKSNYSIIRFRNYNINSSKMTKKKQIYKIIKDKNINVFKKFYSKKNFFTKNILFKPFAHHIIYFITKNDFALNFELCFSEKIKKFLFLKKEVEKLLINKK